MRTTLLLGLLLAFSHAGVGSCSSFRAAQPWHPHLARVRVSDGAPDLDRRAPEPLEGVPSLLQLGQTGPGCNCQEAVAGFAQAQAIPAAEPQAAPGFFAPPAAQEAPAFVPPPGAGMAAQPGMFQYEEAPRTFAPLPDAGVAAPAAQPGVVQHDSRAAAAAAAYAARAGEGQGQRGELAQEALAQRQEVMQLRQQVGLMENRMEQMEAAASHQRGQEALERTLHPQAPLPAAVAEAGAQPLVQAPLFQAAGAEAGALPLLQSPLQAAGAEAGTQPLLQAPLFQAAGTEAGAPPLLQSPLQAGLPVLRQATGEGLTLGQLRQVVAAQGRQLASLATASQAAAVPGGVPPPLQPQQVPAALGLPAPPLGAPLMPQPAYAAAAEQQLLQQAAYEQQRQAMQAQQLAEQAAFAQVMPQAQLLEPWGRQQPLEAMPATVPFVLR